MSDPKESHSGLKVFAAFLMLAGVGWYAYENEKTRIPMTKYTKAERAKLDAELAAIDKKYGLKNGH